MEEIKEFGSGVFIRSVNLSMTAGGSATTKLQNIQDDYICTGILVDIYVDNKKIRESDNSIQLEKFNVNIEDIGRSNNLLSNGSLDIYALEKWGKNNLFQPFRIYGNSSVEVTVNHQSAGTYTGTIDIVITFMGYKENN